MKLAKIDRITFLKLQNLIRKKELIATKQLKECFKIKWTAVKTDSPLKKMD